MTPIRPSDASSGRPLAQLLITGASEVLTCAGPAEGAAEAALGRVAGATVAIGGGKILAVGPEAEVRERLGIAGVGVEVARSGFTALEK